MNEPLQGETQELRSDGVPQSHGSPVFRLPGEPGEHAQHLEQEAHHPEIANLVTLLHDSSLRDTFVVRMLHQWENPFFSLLTVVMLGILFRRAMRRCSLVPHPWQNFLELIVEGLNDFFTDVLGKKYGARFALYVAGLFIFIWTNNILGLVPFLKAPTSVYNTTLALALCTFCVVQYAGIRENGLWGYVLHLLGSPRGVGGWLLGILMLPLHVIGEIAKPVSLSLRLFGNILGEDILLAVFVTLGITLVGLSGVPEWVPGLPLHFPFFFLALLTSTIQALVFSLLSCVYIFLVLPQEDHH